MARRISFLARKPVRRTVSFKARGTTIRFKARVPKRVRVSFWGR
jgi:hypothetical protein